MKAAPVQVGRGGRRHGGEGLPRGAAWSVSSQIFPPPLPGIRGWCV